MSLLLDALRKSESRRRLGQPPGLELPGIPVSSRRPGRGLWLAVPLLLVLAAVGIATWWWWPGAAPPPMGEEPVAATEDSQQAPIQPAPGPDEASPGEAGPRDEARSRPTEPVVRTPDPAPAVEEPEPTRPLTPAPARVPEAEEPAADVDAETPATSVPRHEGESESRPRDGPPAEAESGRERRADPGTVPQAPPVPAAESSPDRVDRGAVAEYLQIWELPRNIREDLPSLDLSINVYSELPESRFALINGERFQEGDEVAPGVVIHRITRDGAVLDFRDYRFLLD